MAKREILAGATDQTIDVFIQDSSSTVGAGLTGLVYNSAGLTCYYRKGATGSATALTLATQTVGGAHSDGGFIEISSTNTPGLYRLDLSDTIVASAGMVSVMLKGATNMAPCVTEIEVISVNKFDSVRMGLTALPNNTGFERAASAIVRGTATTGGSTTSVPTSSLSPAASVADQFKGLVLRFDGDTSTAALRGQPAIVTASTAGGTLTVTQLTTAPASGDTFTMA